MFYVPELLRAKHKGDLLCCWLAGTLSEAMFKNKVSRIRLSAINIVASGEEIMEVVSGRGFNGTPRFSLYLSSHLLYGLIKILTYQLNQLEKSAMKCCSELSTRWVVDKKKNKRTTMQIDLDYILRHDFTIPAPDLSDLLGRPTPRDENLIYEISPESHKRMMEASVSNWNFRMSGEEIGSSIPSIVDIQEPGMVDFSLGFHEDPIVQETVFGTPQKRRLSPGTNVDSPSKRQRVRKSLKDVLRAANDADNRGEATVLPMEQDAESHRLPIDASNDVAPIGTDNRLDNVPVGDVVEPILDAMAPLDTVVPENVIVPEDPSLAIPIVQPTVRPRTKRRRGKRIDAKICIPDDKQFGHRDKQVSLVSMLVAHPGRMIEPPILKRPLGVLNFSNQYLSRLCCNMKELTCTDVLLRYEDASYFPLEAIDFQCPDMLELHLPKNLLSTVDGKLVPNTKKTKTATVEVIVAPPLEILPPETINDPTFDNVSEAQFPFGNIENTEFLENTSGPKTVSVGKVEMLTDPTGNEDTIGRIPSLDPGENDLNDFLPPPTRTRYSKARSSDAVIEITNEAPSLSSQIAEQNAWTKKDLEACLEVYWQDRNIVTFEDLASLNDTSPDEAINCFLLILELDSDGKVELSQNVTNGPITIKKLATSVPMDISQ